MLLLRKQATSVPTRLAKAVYKTKVQKGQRKVTKLQLTGCAKAISACGQGFDLTPGSGIDKARVSAVSGLPARFDRSDAHHILQKNTDRNMQVSWLALTADCPQIRCRPTAIRPVSISKACAPRCTRDQLSVQGLSCPHEQPSYQCASDA